MCAKEAKGLGMQFYAKTFIKDEPFVVLLGDDCCYDENPATRQLVQAIIKLMLNYGVQRKIHEEVSKYGIVRPFSLIHQPKMVVW